MINNKVIIWGIDNFNSLGLLRQLGDTAEVFHLIYGKKTGCTASSKYCKDYAVKATIEEGFEFLKKRFCEEKIKPVIITPGDEIIEFIDQHKPEFEKYFIVPGTTVSGILTKYDNKIRMAELARDVGIDVPWSMTCKPGTTFDNVPFPCFLKPSHIIKGHKNEFKCKKIKNIAELENILKLVRNDSEFLLQEYIPVEKELVVSGYRKRNGQTILSGTYTTLRYADDGNSSYATISGEIPSCVNVTQIEAFMDKIDYHGLFGFEFGLWNGKAYFFEVNLRNDGTSQTFYLAGANRVKAWVYDAIGLDDRSLCVKVKKPGTFMDEMLDISNVWHGKLSYKEWRKQRQNATYLKYYYDKDMGPYKVMRKKRVKLLIQHAVVKRYRPYIVYLMDKFKLG